MNGQELISQITSSAIVVYAIHWLRSLPWARRFIAWLPFADATIHRLLSLVGAIIAALGIHIAFEGNAAIGWHFAGTIPPVVVMLHDAWHIANSYALNQLIYDGVVRQKDLPAVPPTRPLVKLDGPGWPQEAA